MTAVNGATAGPGRVLVAKLGLDGHDVGAKFISRLLRDNGFEVIYLGIRQTPEAVVRAAIDEDVDVLGLSMLSGSHGVLVAKVLELLAAEGAEDLPVVLGGVIPAGDRAQLEELGVAAIFDAGVAPEVLIQRISTLASADR
jgi:methylmalonyl-CoA mutase C-terminal domain/subunit